MFRRLLCLPRTPRSNLLDRVGFQELCFDKSSSIDKATNVTACENNVDVSVTEMASRDQETKPDDAKEAMENETPTTTKTLQEQKPEDTQPPKNTGTEDENSSQQPEANDATKDADKEPTPANQGEDQTKGADKEEAAKDGDDQSIADSPAVFSDSEAKGVKGAGNKSKRPRGGKSNKGANKKS